MARFPIESRRMETLADVAPEVDGFVLDAFGVLNVGDRAIPGAVDRISAFRDSGKSLVVLTNAASYTRDAAVAKFQRLGFDFTKDEIVSSRDVAVAQLSGIAPGARWSAICASDDTFDDIAEAVVDGTDDPNWDEVEAVLFLSTSRWTRERHETLVASLTRKPRPLVVANPDLVAPREGGLTIEPGFWAHDILSRTEVEPHFFGKPYSEAFDVARGRAASRRLAMVGDTLHTDILGGRAAGMQTVLVEGHGLYAGRNVKAYVESCGIVPDYIIGTT